MVLTLIRSLLPSAQGLVFKGAADNDPISVTGELSDSTIYGGSGSDTVVVGGKLTDTLIQTSSGKNTFGIRGSTKAAVGGGSEE